MIKMLKPKVLGASALGAATGFTVNYAVTKILFKPKQTFNVAGMSIPVKGILPSVQPRIADTVENAINAVLKNPKILPPMQKMLMKPEVKNAFIGFAIKLIYETGDKKSVNELIAIFLKEEKKKAVQEALKDFIAKVLVEKTDKEFLGKLITDEGIKIFKEATSNSLLSKLMNERIFASIANAISVAVHKFVETRATEKILNIAFKEIDSLLDMSLPAILKQFLLDEKAMSKLLDSIYDSVLLEVVPEFLSNVDIGALAKSGVLKIDFDKVDSLINTKCQPLIIGFSALGAATCGVATNIVASRMLLK
ncbi:MAG: DUF445 family protein [Clostridia bacterium]|nr:DUF445 family protein [Clostridia bacterium]